MSKTKIIIIIAIFIIAGAGLWFSLPTKKIPVTPSPNIIKQTNIDKTPKIIPADNEFPASGVCADGGTGDTVIVEVNFDVPSPRCQKISAEQKLIIVNNTSVSTMLWFGKNKEYNFTIPAGESFAIPNKLGSLLEPGVHTLFGDPYQGSEIWLGDFKDTPSPIVDTPKNNSPVQSKVILCEPDQRNAEMCTTDFNPVCAKVNIQCIKAPCYPINETFSNSCEACKNSLVESYVVGECS